MVEKSTVHTIHHHLLQVREHLDGLEKSEVGFGSRRARKKEEEEGDQAEALA